MANRTTYPTAHASPRRDGAIPVVSTSAGAPGWSAPLGIADLGAAPSLLVWEDRLVAVGLTDVAVFSPAGKRLWHRSRRPRSPVVVDSRRLYLPTRTLTLDAIEPTNVPAFSDASLPGVRADSYDLRLLWPLENEYVAAISDPNPRYDEESSAPPPQPRVFGRRVEWGEEMAAWAGSAVGKERLSPLFVPERHRLVFGTTEIIVADLRGSEKEFARFPQPFAEPVGWSADADGTLAILGVVKGHDAIVALDLEGKRVWEYADPEAGDPWLSGQFPIRAPGGRTYAFTSTYVRAFEQGKPLWSFDVRREELRLPLQPASTEKPRFEAPPRYGTALADGAIVFTAGHTLRKLDAAGRLVFAVNFESDILAPPVADAEGNLYVLTATHVVQVR